MPEATNPATPASTPPAHHISPESGIVELPGTVLFRVSGKDPRKFLHGQLTQSLDEVTASQSRRAAGCNPKGRAYALMLLADVNGDIVLSLPRSIASDVASHLQKFLMLFRGTTMEEISGARVFGIRGDELVAQLSDKAATLAAPGDSLSLPSGKLIRVMPTAEGCPRYEYWQLEPSDALRDDIVQDKAALNESDWRAGNIAAGIPELEPAIASQYVPQMLNWQHLEGIHFKKGCYTGQEVIARMHYLGQLKKSVFRLKLEGVSSAPAAGTAVVAGEKNVGEVVNSVMFDNGDCEVLAVVKHAALASRPWMLEGSDQAFTPMPLPYTVPEQSNRDD
ncbi:CAF17-like 4Fe-4S cluster assembly/insertion protein YgfZ [Marinobacter sp. 1Y8]